MSEDFLVKTVHHHNTSFLQGVDKYKVAEQCQPQPTWLILFKLYLGFQTKRVYGYENGNIEIEIAQKIMIYVGDSYFNYVYLKTVGKVLNEW